MAATFFPTVQYSTPARSSVTETWKALERKHAPASLAVATGLDANTAAVGSP